MTSADILNFIIMA